MTSGLSIATEAALCADLHVLTATPERGSAPYTYRWFGEGEVELGSSAAIDSLPAGSYRVEVRDASGCSSEALVALRPVDFLRLIDVRPLAECDAVGGILEVTAAGGAEPLTYGLQGEAGSPDADVAVPSEGTYAVEVSDSDGCVVTSEEVTLNTPVDFAVDVGADRTIALGENVRIRTLVGPADVPGLQFAWVPAGAGLSCADCPNPTARPTRSTTYVVVATSAEGCLRTDSLTVGVDASVPVYFPSAFSPNGDGRNDRYRPFPGLGASAVEYLRIFDRWGGLCYDADLGDGGWDGSVDGRPAATGPYAYTSRVRLLNGEVVEYSGVLTLHR